MFFGVCLGVFLLQFLWDMSKCAHLPSGVHMECHDRFFMIAFESLFGEEPRFEAVDGSGVFPITETYAAKCGYSISSRPSELRASYFSCHTQNTDDNQFTFNFNLIVTRDGKEITYALKKTCSPSLPWSPREVTCEENYMEVSLQSELTCRSGAEAADWDALTVAHGSTTSDWQVMFQKAGEMLTPITIKEARRRGYVFDVTNRRLLFRTPYGQPDAFNATVNDVPVEVVQASLFSRQNWVVLMVDLVVTCSRHGGSYGGGRYVTWKTPETLIPGLNTQQIRVGLGGELMEQPVAENRGYVIETHNNTVRISVPYNAEGRHRTREFFTFHLYLEQILVDEGGAETRLRLHRTITTDLLRRPVVPDNRTVTKDQISTIFLGDVPEGVVPPTFYASCSDTGIVFRVDRRHLNKWEVVVGSDTLTSDLADQYGYIVRNNGADLLLMAPLFTQGYEYENITLEGFYGTFEVRVRDRKTSNIYSSTVKRCPFTAQELIVCSTDGMMTVVADLSLAVPSGGVLTRTNLLDKHCGPRETDGTRALFSFPVNSCGSVVKLRNENVTYENTIFYGEAAPDDSTDRVTVRCTYPLSGLHRLFSTLAFESDSAGFGSIAHTLQATAGPSATLFLTYGTRKVVFSGPKTQIKQPQTNKSLKRPTITSTVSTTNRPIRTAGPHERARPPSVRYIRVHPRLRSFIQRHHMGAEEDKRN